jgi:colanic acid/amylovoran biosynthesis glycosyltransferase
MRIAYLIPEFPGQTHAFFWRERAALTRIGVTTIVLSTRRPPRGIASHDWVQQAESETFYLADIGFSDIALSIIEFLRCGPGSWTRAIKAALDGCPPRKLPANIALMLIAARLIAFMRAKRLTHIHSHSCADSALIAMFANRLAYITYSLTLHGNLLHYGRQQRAKWRYAAFAITITTRLYDQIREELGRETPLGLAPMGVDPSFFRRTRAYRPWSGEGPLRLFSCGRLNYAKGYQDLIHAISILKQFRMRIKLEIAGEDESGGRGFHQDLNSLIASLQLTDTVVLLGAVSEQRVLMGLESAHLFVHPSHDEALGVAIMEAMSCETPVIATDPGGVRELIDHGLDGYLISPRDPESLAKSILYMANNPSLAEKFSASGREKILQRFNSNLSAIELKRLLQQMR